ncbi:hypothetical protein BGZ76_001483 [Entomortierella beljakovae]|nr:hypothetical protein BGZ76_001483 [Entomortierella beljakovae]
MPAQSTASSIISRYLTKGNISKLFLAYILHIVFKYRRTVYGIKPRTDIPGPRGLPLIGNTIDMLSIPLTEILEAHVKFRERYGRVYAMTVPKVGRIIYANEPQALDHVLRTNFWNYEKGDALRLVSEPLVGKGIFGADGEHWKWQRKAASNIFSVKAFRQYTSDVFCIEGETAIEFLNKCVESGEAVDLQQLFYSYTLDSFGRIAYGESFECLKNPEKENEFAAAYDRITYGIAGRIYTPIWRLTDWLSGNGKQVEKDSKYLREFGQGMIDKRRQQIKDGLISSDKKDLLQLFLDLEHDGESLSDSMLIDSILNFIIAGRDTTAQSLAWMFYHLLEGNSDPEVIEKINKESDEILQGGYPTYESTKQQKYLEACFYEAVRLYPSVPRATRRCIEDDVLPDGTKVYKGERVGWCSWAMSRDPGIWGPDAKEYKPDRWATKDKPHSSKFVSFHHGPRTCIGQQYATIEAITISSMLLRKFSFELVEPSAKATYSPSLTLPMAKGLFVRVKHRSPVTTV